GDLAQAARAGQPVVIPGRANRRSGEPRIQKLALMQVSGFRVRRFSRRPRMTKETAPGSVEGATRGRSFLPGSTRAGMAHNGEQVFRLAEGNFRKGANFR